jgi:acetylornithine deacetylase/succinyl-diaminopimelate desuccinylase-like protein
MSARWTAATLVIGLLLVAARGAAREPDWPAVSAQAAELLSAYIRIDTTNPPGDTRAAADFLAAQLDAAGATTERIAADPSKPMVIGRRRGRGAGTGKPIVLLNHMDVVPADPKRWSFPPFSGEIRDGVVYGRGALDMKGLAIAQLMAVRLLAAGDGTQHDLVYLAVPDEEVGGTLGAAWIAQQRPDLLDAMAVWDEGGIGLTDMLPAPAFFISVTEKQVLWLRIVAEGPAGHGSRPFSNAAPRRLVEAVNRVLASPAAPRLTPIARQVFRSVGANVGGFEGLAMRHLKNPVVWLFSDGLLQQEPWTSALTRDTVALTMLNGGYKPNVIPERAEAVFDCRLLPDTKPATFIEQLRDTIDDPEVRIEIIQSPETAAPSPTDNPLFLAMRDATGIVYPGVVVTESMTSVGTDSRFFRRRGTPAYGFFPVLISKELNASVHGVDERLPVEDLGKAVRVFYEALKTL